MYDSPYTKLYVCRVENDPYDDELLEEFSRYILMLMEDGIHEHGDTIWHTAHPSVEKRKYSRVLYGPFDTFAIDANMQLEKLEYDAEEREVIPYDAHIDRVLYVKEEWLFEDFLEMEPASV